MEGLTGSTPDLPGHRGNVTDFQVDEGLSVPLKVREGLRTRDRTALNRSTSAIYKFYRYTISYKRTIMPPSSSSTSEPVPDEEEWLEVRNESLVNIQGNIASISSSPFDSATA